MCRPVPYHPDHHELNLVLLLVPSLLPFSFSMILTQQYTTIHNISTQHSLYLLYILDIVAVTFLSNLLCQTFAVLCNLTRLLRATAKRTSCSDIHIGQIPNDDKNVTSNVGDESHNRRRAATTATAAPSSMSICVIYSLCNSLSSTPL